MLIDANLVEVVSTDVVDVHVRLLRLVIWLLLDLLLHPVLLRLAFNVLLLGLFEGLLALASLPSRWVRHDSLRLGDWLECDTRRPGPLSRVLVIISHLLAELEGCCLGLRSRVERVVLSRIAKVRVPLREA